MSGTETWVRTYQNGLDYIESLDGTDWMNAPLPYPWHHCKPQTRGWFGVNYTERCACGASRNRAYGPWLNKNETRRWRARERRDARAPKEIVTCSECGQPYEAVAGSAIAREMQCSRCWGDALVRDYGWRQ